MSESSVWQHAICAPCWNRRYPDKWIVERLGRERCCFCALDQAGGIYVRENPMLVLCRGRHDFPSQQGADYEECRHEPADPAAMKSICWHCGAMIHRHKVTGRWITREHALARLVRGERSGQVGAGRTGMNRTATIVFLLLLSGEAGAATWYVRADGGTRYSAAKTNGQCDGLADAAYPGSGTNQHCAFNDIRFLWADGVYATGPGSHWGWVGQGGDTYILDCPNAGCRIGYENGATSNGYQNAQGWAVALAGNPYGSGALPPPNGTPAAHTRILGKNWQSCADDASKTHINGGYGVNPAISLRGASYVDVACLNISDHSACTRGSQGGCQTSYPMDDYATNGIATSNTTTHVTFTDILIHGTAGNGMIGPTGDGVKLERVTLAGNPLSGWNMDAGDGTTGSGNLTLDHVRILWNGCGEEYPVVDPLPYLNCTDQNSGGYGDGIGTATVGSNPAWHVVITNSEAAYNTQDGFDLLHLQGSGSTLTVTESLMHSNMGQQLKAGGASTTRNNLIVGNCNALRQAIPGTPAGYNAALSNFCRAADTAVALAVLNGEPTIFQFNTILNAGATTVQISCGNKSCTPEGASILYENNTFVGFKNSVENGYPANGNNDYSNPIYLDAAVSSLFSNPATKFDHNSTFHAKSNWACPQVKWNEQQAVCGDPALTDMTWHLYGYGNMTPLALSPLIAAGIAVQGVTQDYAGTARPDPPTIAAYEGGTAPIASYTVTVDNLGAGSADKCRGTYTQGQPFQCILTGGENLITIDGCGGTRSGDKFSGTVTAHCVITAQFLWLASPTAAASAGQHRGWLFLLVLVLVLVLVAVALLWYFRRRPRKSNPQK